MEKDQLQDVTVPIAVQPLDSNRDLNNFLISIWQHLLKQLNTFKFILLFGVSFYVGH